MLRKVPIVGWSGWDDSQPPLSLPTNSFKQITNWLIYKGTLRPLPNLIGIANPGTPAQVINTIRTFMDALSEFHTVALTPNAAFYRNADGSYRNIFSFPSAVPIWTPTLDGPYANEVFLSRFFFSNGSIPLTYIEGDQFWYVAGDVPGGANFIGKLAGHLILANTTEPATGAPGSLPYPARVRWCGAVGNFKEWDSSIDYTAGVVDIADVEDQLTGWATIGTNGFAFRNNGMTVFTPAQFGLAAFTVENFSIGPSGVGVSNPYTLASYGTFCVFKALDDIYLFYGAAPEPIGGKAKRKIFADFETSSSEPTSIIIGNLGQGIEYLSYWLAIPQSNDTISSVWIYHFDDHSWVNVQMPFGALRTMANVALT